MSVSSESADAIIVGGGPAGCTTAILLKKYNPSARIVIFEKEKFPRHHVGESTLPDANAVLHKLGVIDALNDAGFPIKCGLTYKWRHDRPIFTDLFSKGVHPNLQDRLYPKGIPDHSWQVDRGLYDSILLNRAKQVGVEVHELTTVTGVLRDECQPERISGVSYRPRDNSRTSTMKARTTVDASGQGRRFSNWLAIEVEKFPLGDTALYRYYKGLIWTKELIGSFYDGKVFFTSVPRGWMWLIPISQDTASVGLVTRKAFLSDGPVDQVFEEELAHSREIQGMLAGASHVSHAYTSDAPATYVIQDWTYRNRHFAGSGWYLVGDAAAFVDPILSSGLNLAHNCGLLAANAINTEWNYPDVPVQMVRSGYETLYREIYHSFLSMAAWWYERRHTDVADWWKVAREQSGRTPGVANLSDREVFLTFTAGYVTDFRFISVGAGGYGAQGLNSVFDNIPEEPIEEKLHRSDMNVGTHLLPTFDRHEIRSYYGSHVGTNRWWKLPSVVFHRGEEQIPFHPSVMESEQDDETLLVELSERLVCKTLDYLDGHTSATQVARVLQADFGGFDQKRHNFVMKLMHNLVTVGLLREP